MLFIQIVTPGPKERNYSILESSFQDSIRHILSKLILVVHLGVHLNYESCFNLHFRWLRVIWPFCIFSEIFDKSTVCLVVQISARKWRPNKRKILTFKAFRKLLQSCLFYLHKLELVHSENGASFDVIVGIFSWWGWSVTQARDERRFGTGAKVRIECQCISLSALRIQLFVTLSGTYCSMPWSIFAISTFDVLQ